MTQDVVSDRFADHFWAGIAAGELRIQRCADCGRAVFYPRALCPHCHSERLEWTASTGLGEIHSYTVVHRASGPYASDPPYPVALVDLDEGVRLLAQLVEVAPDAVGIGMRVSVRFVDVNGRAVFRFAPEDSGTA